MKKFLTAVFAASLALLFSCSIQKAAMNMAANALTGSGGTDIFTSDNDPVLIRDALPFTIKMYETLLEANPNHQGLLNTTGSLFVMYANAFVQGPAEQLPREFFLERREAMERSKNLYLRGLNLLYRGLELKYPGFSTSFQNGRLEEYLLKMKKPDAHALYWSSAAGLSAFSFNPFDMELGVRLPEFYALAERAYDLDPFFNYGALDELLMIYFASVPEGMGGDKSKIDIYYERALEKSNGLSAGLFVSYAQSVCVPAQDYEKFKEMLEKALSVNPDERPQTRLVNLLAQQKARFLLDSAVLFFFSINNMEDYDED